MFTRYARTGGRVTLRCHGAVMHAHADRPAIAIAGPGRNSLRRPTSRLWLAGVPAYSSSRLRVLARGTSKAMRKTVSSSLGQPWHHDVLPPQWCVSVEIEHGMVLTSMPLSAP
jgi:hypothetical protein